MLDKLRPDATTEGWNTWPTEKVSHALVSDTHSRAIVQRRATELLATTPPDMTPFMLAPYIRDTLESLVTGGRPEGLREGLVTFALSRVDWLQLAAAQIEAVTPEEDPEPETAGAFQFCPL